MARRLNKDNVLDNFEKTTGDTFNEDKVNLVLHNTHCYIIGEISNYLSGRSFTTDEAKLGKQITDEAVRMFRLCLLGE